MLLAEAQRGCARSVAVKGEWLNVRRHPATQRPSPTSDCAGGAVAARRTGGRGPWRASSGRQSSTGRPGTPGSLRWAPWSTGLQSPPRRRLLRGDP
eukprot:8305368-Pyramimonas_sp.AAC.1